MRGLLRPTTLFIATSLVALFLVQGCSSGGIDVDIKNVESDASSSDGLDPLERGKMRRAILNDTEEGVAIWLKGDSAGYSKAYTKELAASYLDQLEKLHQKGTDKVRRHENQLFEVVELTKDSATVKYTFVDKSYFISTSTSEVVNPAKNAESEIYINVVKEDNRWKIQALIGAGEATL